MANDQSRSDTPADSISDAVADALAEAGGGIARPRLRPDHPILWRANNRLQLGMTDRAVIISEASTAMADWLHAIDGTRSWQQLSQHLARCGLSLEQAQRSLWFARGSGALDDASAMPDMLRWADRELRDELSADLASAGFTYGDGPTANIVIDRRLTTKVDVQGVGRLADELREALAQSGLALHREQPDIRLLADAAHPWIIDAPQGDALPHLPLAVFGDVGHVGPLVVPGRTSCCRCAYLHQRDADPDWPVLRLQFEQAAQQLHIAPADRLLIRATALAAVLLVRRWADDPLATTDWADQILQVHLPDGHFERRMAPAHALCGCRWPEQAA